MEGCGVIFKGRLFAYVNTHLRRVGQWEPSAMTDTRRGGTPTTARVLQRALGDDVLGNALGNALGLANLGNLSFLVVEPAVRQLSLTVPSCSSLQKWPDTRQSDSEVTSIG